MLSGLGRYRGSRSGFSKSPNLGSPGASQATAAAAMMSSYVEQANGMAANVPEGTLVRSFAKPSNVGLQIGLVPTDPHMTIILAREMYENDPVLGAVVETISGIPFGDFSLSGLPDVETAKPYEVSLDRIRSKTLLPVLSNSFLVDGAFLGGGMFDEHEKVWSAVIPYDVLHSTITPAPFFGATPIVDIQVQQDVMRRVRSGDERMQRYRKYLPEQFLSGGVIKLPPENTFYVPRGSLAHVSLGTSIYRKVMIVYLLEKALARGTVEMAYRRQRPLLHVQAGDELWDASVAEMQFLADLFMQSDLDPLAATVVTRPGVNVQEVGGLGEMWKWTDNIDVLTSLKLKGMGMPDGLLGGDMALDSVSATLTVFINMMRKHREYITRLFFYEKFFPYVAITNNHRKDHYHFEGSRYMSRSAEAEVDMEDYFCPTLSWHSSLRPEGDREYMELLQMMKEMGVPVPVRVIATAGGLDIHDVLNSAPDDLKIRKQIADINEQIAALDQQGIGMGAPGDQGYGDDQQQQGFASEDPGVRQRAALRTTRSQLASLLESPHRPKGILNRKYDDRYDPRTEINGHRYVTTAREKRRVEERVNKMTSKAMAKLARKLNHPAYRTQHVKFSRD